MTAGKSDTPAPTPFGGRTADLAIRLGLLGLVGYWSLQVIAPFLTIVLWSAILTVALYPLFDWLAGHLRRRRLAAVLVTLLSLMVVIGPVTWLVVHRSRRNNAGRSRNIHTCEAQRSRSYEGVAVRWPRRKFIR